MSWTRPAVAGSGAPSARCAHSAELAGKLFIFGGWNGQRMLNDCSVLHLGTRALSAAPVLRSCSLRCSCG